ncbi:glycoside hydrolase superfamily [Xylaria arbuscula]|nr:glycoside hydrolase superfamily [Xylaria arbuscula]
MKMHKATLFVAFTSAASVARLGFNYGSTFTNGTPKTQADFEGEFTTAANLEGTKGWTGARLYTTVQAGTTNDPISAIPAAIYTNTSLLLGMWASAGDAAFDNELAALKAAIEQYGDYLWYALDGISIGSEDMYRNSPQGIAAGSNPGLDPDVLVKYIRQVKEAINGTALEGVRLGHVDTWTAWENSSSRAVVDELDWIGMDAYPYFQHNMSNAIGQSKALFSDALERTRAAAAGKPVWITETGHPVSGNISGDSVASIENAEEFWKTVGCPMFGDISVWWYTLQDSAPDMPNPSFGIIGSNLTTRPLFDLSCGDMEVNSVSFSTTSTTSASASALTSNPTTSVPTSTPRTLTNMMTTITDQSVAPTLSETRSNTADTRGDNSSVSVPTSSSQAIQHTTTLAPNITSESSITNVPTKTVSSSNESLSAITSPDSGSSVELSVTSASLAPSSASPASSDISAGESMRPGGLRAAFFAIFAGFLFCW